MGNIKGKITIDELSPELKEEINNANSSISDLENKLEIVKKAQEENFQKVSDGKNIMASAITDKGVKTLATDKFDVMASNIRKIKTGYISGDKIPLDKVDMEYSYNDHYILFDQFSAFTSSRVSRLESNILVDKNYTKIFFRIYNNDGTKFYLYHLNNQTIKSYSEPCITSGDNTQTYMQYDKNKDCFFYATSENAKYDNGLKCIKNTDGTIYELVQTTLRPSMLLDKNYLYAYCTEINQSYLIYFKFNYDGTQIWKKETTTTRSSKAFCYNGYLYIYDNGDKFIEKAEIETTKIISKYIYEFDMHNIRINNNYLYKFFNYDLYIVNLDSMELEWKIKTPANIVDIYNYNDYLFILLDNKTVLKYKQDKQISTYNKTSLSVDVAIIANENEMYIFNNQINCSDLNVNHYKKEKTIKNINLK